MLAIERVTLNSVKKIIGVFLANYALFLRPEIFNGKPYDIISVPSYAAGMYHRTKVRYHIGDISPVPAGTDIIEKSLFCQADKRGIFFGRGDAIRTRNLRFWRPLLYR